MKKIPQRTCIGCNGKRDKKSLIRIVKSKESTISIDLTGRKDGRGIYLCKSEECLNKAIKNKRISRTFEMEVDDKIYENLRKFINGGEIIG